MSKDKSKVAQKGKGPAQAGKSAGPLAPQRPLLSRKIEIAILAVILLGAAALRLADRDQAPPGLNQDEAANGWNAWCLLKTGKDQAGVSWPLFYMRALGSNYTPLNMYLLMPLQALGGINVWTTRGTAALGGILTVFLIYFVGKRLLGTGAGLLAAGLLTLNPWHLFTCRWGIEANICPLLAIAPLALLLAARLIRGGGAEGIGDTTLCENRDRPHFPAAEKWGLSQLSPKPPRIWLAALAGIVTGLCFYGYPAILIFLPLFLVALVLVTWRQWWGCLRGDRRCGGVSPLRAEDVSPSIASSSVSSSSSSSPSSSSSSSSAAPAFRKGKRKGKEEKEETRGRDAHGTQGQDALATGGARVSRRGLIAVLAFVIPAAAIFAPLGYMHAFRGEEIRKRAGGQWIWEIEPSPDGEYSLGTKLSAVAARYFDHFGPDFLFLQGDHSSIESPPGMGMFHWYMLPLFLLGAVWCVWKFRSSPAARVILVFAILYPIGDSLFWSTGDRGELCLHSLRSSPGICGMVLLAAAGGAWAGSWLLRQNRSAFWAAACALVLAAGGFGARYLTVFFGEYNRRPFIYHRYHADLVEACHWLRGNSETGKPRLDQYDAVVCTTLNINQPYILLLHELAYDPARWLADPKDRDASSMFDQYFGFGKFTFLQYRQQVERDGRPRLVLDGRSQERLGAARAAGGGRKAILLIRPGEDQLLPGVGPLKMVHEITDPDGHPSLLLCEGAL